MNFLKKIFSSSKDSKIEDNTTNLNLNLALDESFVSKFTAKNGKFLYCTHQEQVNQNLLKILQENSWEDVYCLNNDLQKLLLIANANSTLKQQIKNPFFTICENLLAENGDILFTSNQLGEIKLKDLPINFIVFAKTSQIVKDKGDALINITSKKNKTIPTNIGAIKCYDPNKKKDDDFMSYGNNNSKNLYLLLLEDL